VCSDALAVLLRVKTAEAHVVWGMRRLAAAVVGKGNVTQAGMIWFLGAGISREEFELYRIASVGMTTSREQGPERRETQEVSKSRSYHTDPEGRPLQDAKRSATRKLRKADPSFRSG
jgi:hypothetical protein